MDGISSCLFLVPVVMVVSLLWFLFRRARISKAVFLNNVLLVLTVVVIMDKVFFPLPLSASEIENMRLGSANLPGYNLVPFHTIASQLAGSVSARWAFIQLGGNIVLFIPLGFLITWRLFQRNNKINALKTIALCVVSSAFVEAVQLLLSFAYGYAYRFADIDDLFLNTFGGALGVAAFVVSLPLVKAWLYKSGKPVASNLS